MPSEDERRTFWKMLFGAEPVLSVPAVPLNSLWPLGRRFTAAIGGFFDSTSLLGGLFSASVSSPQSDRGSMASPDVRSLGFAVSSFRAHIFRPRNLRSAFLMRTYSALDAASAFSMSPFKKEHKATRRSSAQSASLFRDQNASENVFFGNGMPAAKSPTVFLNVSNSEYLFLLVHELPISASFMMIV